MHRIGLTILVCVLLASVAAGDDERDSRPLLQKPPYGSIARQKLLQFRLRMIHEGTLSASLDHNENEWESLPPDRRDQYRRNALAFLKKNPDQQDKLLKHYEKLIKMDAQKRDAYRRRAVWLNIVVESFRPEERKALLEMSPDQRAKKLIDRRDLLVRQGKLKLEEPAPALAPVTVPAGKGASD